MANERVRQAKGRKSDDYIDVVLRVPKITMEEAWQQLERPMKDGPDFMHMVCCYEEECPEWYFSEDELRLLCGVFVEASRCLPMDSYEYIRWIDAHDERLSRRQYINDFIEERLKANPDTLWAFDDGLLDTLTAKAPAVKAERAERRAKEEARRQREKVRQAAWTEERRRRRAEAKKALEAAAEAA